MRLTFDEIEDDKVFEQLTASYFRELKEIPDNSITNVLVHETGEGTDGGRDILIEFDLSDDIKVFKRRWVIQCKFREDSVSPSHLKSINIPTLIHSYNAQGYLLVCKKTATSGVTELFERLNNQCKDKYHYECWNGSQFLSKLILQEKIQKLFFPEYYEYIQTFKNKVK
ncbi:restriction endonuclease [uncultured Algibacter sp.]|jgi:hypothetical protein|uniref:restriction endonuclease n=1 Tax=uncultured Algibacter sp. TaxID=298659 RepID=UPI00262FEF42|nr:restriction endonuclease [uncultured Algibacter sp.]